MKVSEEPPLVSHPRAGCVEKLKVFRGCVRNINVNHDEVSYYDYYYYYRTTTRDLKRFPVPDELRAEGFTTWS